MKKVSYIMVKLYFISDANRKSGFILHLYFNYQQRQQYREYYMACEYHHYTIQGKQEQGLRSL